jgi:hypothetical protein
MKCRMLSISLGSDFVLKLEERVRSRLKVGHESARPPLSQRLIKILNQIVGVLETNRQPQQTFR